MVSDDDVVRVRVTRSGLFLPHLSIESPQVRGSVLGEVIDPGTGSIRETVVMPFDGSIMALRDHPVVSSGEMVARILRKVD